MRTRAQAPWFGLFPEQRRIQARHPSQLPKLRVPDAPVPATVSAQVPNAEQWKMTLDEAIRIGLANSRVVRILGGSSGRTVYDPAIANTEIDQGTGVFDPSVVWSNDFHGRKPPSAAFDPFDPTRVLIDGIRSDSYNMIFGLSKTTVTGGTARVDVKADRFQLATGGVPLNPEIPSATELSFTQPLLQGGGPAANLALIEIARIDTERSFFQLKDSVEEMFRGVVEAYWALVFARADVWAREQQVGQGREAFQRAEANLRAGLGDAADVAQARSALADFRAGSITARANALQREAVLRNILGLPPADGARIIPVTPPSREQPDIDWNEIVRVAAEQRPDMIELKLILEADQQRLIIANNEALPRVDATALYRWNGLEGRTPDRAYLTSAGGNFTGWQLGVSFSVPLGLRRERAALRRQELIIMRDRANLQQGLHDATHRLATTYRNLAQFHEQYQAFRETREAARANLDVQVARYVSGQDTLYLNVLQAITQWGNAVSAEARALTSYNAELANLQREMGVILETHGVRFVEERYGSIGPLGRLFGEQCYAEALRPGPNQDRYGGTDEPAENFFDLVAPKIMRRDSSPPNPPPQLRLRLQAPEAIPAPVPERR